MISVKTMATDLETRKEELYQAVRAVDMKRKPYYGAVKKVADDMKVTPAAIHYHIRMRNIDVLLRLIKEIRSRVERELWKARHSRQHAA